MTTARSQALAALNDFQTSLRKILAETTRMCDGRLDKKGMELFHSAVQQVIASDVKLQEAIEAAEQHAQKHEELKRLAAEVEEKDRQINELAQRLIQVEATLQSAVDAAEPRLEAWKHAQEHPVRLSDLINYAHKISYNTAAPQGWGPHNMLMAFRAPAPQEAVEMPASILFRGEQIEHSALQAYSAHMAATRTAALPPPPPLPAPLPASRASAGVAAAAAASTPASSTSAAAPPPPPPPSAVGGTPVTPAPFVQELLRQFPNELAGVPPQLLALIPPPPAGWRPGDPLVLPSPEALAAALAGMMSGGGGGGDPGADSRGTKRKAE